MATSPSLGSRRRDGDGGLGVVAQGAVRPSKREDNMILEKNNLSFQFSIFIKKTLDFERNNYGVLRFFEAMISINISPLTGFRHNK